MSEQIQEVSSEAPKKKRGGLIIDAGTFKGFYVEPERCIIIGHDTPHKSKAEHKLWQNRALEPVDEALAQDMAKNGFTSVIDLRKDGPNYEVVVGRRRVKAARRANEIRAELGLLPLKCACIVKTYKSDVALVGHMISENALRLDVHPLDMAVDLCGFMEIGASEEEACTVSGKTLQQLRSTLKLLDLDESLQLAIREGVLPVSAGIELADLTRDAQKVELARIKSGEAKSSVTEVRARVKAHKSGSEEAVVVPGKRLINKLLAHDNAEEIFGKDGVRALRYAIGELSARQFGGLTDLIREVKGE